MSTVHYLKFEPVLGIGSSSLGNPKTIFDRLDEPIALKVLGHVHNILFLILCHMIIYFIRFMPLPQIFLELMFPRQ